MHSACAAGEVGNIATDAKPQSAPATVEPTDQ